MRRIGVQADVTAGTPIGAVVGYVVIAEDQAAVRRAMPESRGAPALFGIRPRATTNAPAWRFGIRARMR